ncbi:MAG: DUF92 domain-containing protein [Calditrichia bacterium]
MLRSSTLFAVIPASDWLHLIGLFMVVVLLILMAEKIRKELKWPQEVTRKMVHISVGLLMLSTPLLLKSALPLLLLSAFFTLFNTIAVRKNLFPGIHIRNDNYGTAFYALSFFILVLLFWSDYKIIILASVLIMAVGDAGAAIIGANIRNPHRYRLIRDVKSLEGSAAMLLISSGAVLLITLFYPQAVPGNAADLLLIAISLGIIAAAAESLGDHGSDNLWVPLVTAIVFYYMLTGGSDARLQVYLAIIFGGSFILLSWRLRFLSGSGAVAAFLLAVIVYGFGGWMWTVPVLAFFILSSLLSKAGKVQKQQYDLIFEKGDQRDYLQVLANGGVAGFIMIMMILNPSPVLYAAFLGALAAASADTWATETGVLLGRNPRLITTAKLVPSGTSGGITVAGLTGAFAGGLAIGFSSLLFLNFRSTGEWLPFILLVGLSGLLGSLADSFLGAVLQVQYRCPYCSKITEKKVHCGSKPALPVKGIHWINNDFVNFVNTICGAGAMWLFWLLFFES